MDEHWNLFRERLYARVSFHQGIVDKQRARGLRTTKHEAILHELQELQKFFAQVSPPA